MRTDEHQKATTAAIRQYIALTYSNRPTFTRGQAVERIAKTLKKDPWFHADMLQNTLAQAGVDDIEDLSEEEQAAADRLVDHRFNMMAQMIAADGPSNNLLRVLVDNPWLAMRAVSKTSNKLINMLTSATASPTPGNPTYRDPTMTNLSEFAIGDGSSLANINNNAQLAAELATAKTLADTELSQTELALATEALNTQIAQEENHENELQNEDAAAENQDTSNREDESSHHSPKPTQAEKALDGDDLKKLTKHELSRHKSKVKKLVEKLAEAKEANHGLKSHIKQFTMNR